MKVKNIFAGIGITAILLAASIPVFAQQTSSATANANASVVTPIEISVGNDLNFGNLAVKATPGTIFIDVSSGAMARSRTGGVSLPATAGTTSAASFNVTGQGNYQYTIAISPSTVTLNNITTGVGTMTVTGLHSYPPSPGTLSAAGTQTVLVGGTLNVNANQDVGVYSSAAPITVTVSYQ